MKSATRLILPSTKYKKSFIEAAREFKQENNWYVLSVNISIDKAAKDFSAYVKRVRNLSKGIGVIKGYVPETVYWLVDDKKFIGRASIRHRLTKHLLLIGGHIGYEVRPSEREKGYGKKILEIALIKARQLGIKKVLVTCDETNTASRKIIEHCEGVLEDARSQGRGKPKKLRFWITNIGSGSTHPKKKKEIYVDPRHHEHAFDLPFWRDNKKLWALDVPVEKMNIEKLLWIFDVPFWEDEDGNIVITPNEVIHHPNQYPYHSDKIKNSDTSYPLDIMRNKKGKWLTLDGLHRLVQLAITGKKVIKVRKIPPEIIHLTARDE